MAFYDFLSCLSCRYTCPKLVQRALSMAQSSSENIENGKEFFENPTKCLRLPNSSDLASLIIRCRSASHSADELARFVMDLTASRKREFARLTVRDLFPDSA